MNQSICIYLAIHTQPLSIKQIRKFWSSAYFPKITKLDLKLEAFWINESANQSTHQYIFNLRVIHWILNLCMWLCVCVCVWMHACGPACVSVSISQSACHINLKLKLLLSEIEIRFSSVKFVWLNQWLTHQQTGI